MSLHHWVEIEFKDDIYIVHHPEGVKKFVDKLKLLKWIDKFLVGRRKLREVKTEG